MSDLRRAEFAVAAFGATAFLLALLFVLDAVRFHGDVLVATVEGVPRGELHGRGLLLFTLALFDLLALARALRCVGRGVAAHRRCSRGCRCSSIASSPGASSRSCRGAPAGVLRGPAAPARLPLQRRAGGLSEDALAAVVEHEAHHASRRDPLRILIARAIGEAYSLSALPRREQALSELAADAAAVRRRGAAPLAAALLAFDAGGSRPSASTGSRARAPSDQVPRALVAGAGS